MRLFGYVILKQDNKQWKFLLSHLEKYHLSIYKEKYHDGDLKSETFALT